MSVSRKISDPVGIVNASCQPEIVIELNGMVLSMKPPASGPDAAVVPDDAADND